MRLIVAASLVVASAGMAAAQDLAYEKYQLDNGMTVILHEDHSLPVATVNLWYRVGSKDEPKRRSGFAHLFEHLMFMGTRRVPGNDFDKLMEAGGGSNNATTSSDRTNYFSSGPASLLPTLLWLDADRLEDLGRNMDQKKLDRQREVVRNERRQSHENRPYGKAELILEELMYPEGHPYHIPVIGTHEDLEAATVQDVKDFFATYYVPNNASLVVAGDFDKAKTKELIAKLFGSIPRGATPERRSAGPVKLDRVIRATTVDKVPHAQITFSYHSPALFAAGDAELDLASSVLSSGTSSRLYKRLVYDEKLAVQVSAYQQSAQLGSLFKVEVTVQPGASLDAVEKAIDEELAKFMKDGPTPGELARAKAAIELAAVTRLEGIEAKADKLNEYEYYFGEPNSLNRDLDRYRKATAEDVRDWARKVLTPEARLVLRVLPEEATGEPTPRDERPQDGANGAFAPPAPVEFKLSNGIPVRLWTRNDLPLVSMRVLFARRSLLDPTGKQAGVEPLTADLMTEGAGDLDALAFGDALQELGAELSISAGRENAEVALTVLERNLARATELAAWAIRKPRFEEKELERVKRLHLEKLAEDDDEPTTVAARVAQKLLYKDGRWAVATDGTTETVQPLGLADVKKAHAELFRPELATIHVAGAVKADELKAVLEKLLGDWKPAAGAAVNEGPAVAIPTRDKMQVYVVERPEAVQTVIRFSAPGFKLGDEKRVALRVLNTVLGGSFTSRLNANLREAHGWTYGAGSRFSMERSTGTFAASSSVRADVTGDAVKEFLGELTRIRAGDVTDDEVRKARETLRTEMIQAFSGVRGIAGVADDLVFAGLPYSTLASDLAALAKVDAASINALAKEAIAYDRGVLVLVGDRKLILEQIGPLALGDVKLVDAHAMPAMTPK